MQNAITRYTAPEELLLGSRINMHIPKMDQVRQRKEVDEILSRLQRQPGVILGDEVGMGKTFVALAVAYSIARQSNLGPVILMVPGNLLGKWEQDFRTFCDLYLDNRTPVKKGEGSRKEWVSELAVRYGAVRHSVELMKLLDAPLKERCHIIFLAKGSMGRKQSDKWVRLALIAEALRRHAHGRNQRLIQVKKQLHRFMGRLLQARFMERGYDFGEKLWHTLIMAKPERWMDLHNKMIKNEKKRLEDDPVPKAILQKLAHTDLRELAETLKMLPVRARGGDKRIEARLNKARTALHHVEENLWKKILANPQWRSPLFVMDEAHHLKNPGTSLARRFKSPESETIMKTGDSALANIFDRMLFLTATPFQLGHHELVRVLERFGDVCWSQEELGPRTDFLQKISDLEKRLTEYQRATVRLQKRWSSLGQEDSQDDVNIWWDELIENPDEKTSAKLKTVLTAFKKAKEARDAAKEAISPWIIRHNKESHWAGTDVPRRLRFIGAGLIDHQQSGGLPVPEDQLLPFYLAARSAVNPSKDVLGDALSSSFEAFRHTKNNRIPELDEQGDDRVDSMDTSYSSWYLEHFDRTISRLSGHVHPKICATVRKAVELWEAGEKILIFAYYRKTCRALRIHISKEIERRIRDRGLERIRKKGQHAGDESLASIIHNIQERFFDKKDSPGRRSLDQQLNSILKTRSRDMQKVGITSTQTEEILDIMRRFLRTNSSIVRFFPLESYNSLTPEESVERVLDARDGSGRSQREKYFDFITFLTNKCSPTERTEYLQAALNVETGNIWVDDIDAETSGISKRILTLPNIQEITGATGRDTRARLMRTFNTPFFPGILVCSQVMGEGVDLQRFCRYVIHHDLAWNPSAIEQRTGRIDRLGSKASETHHSIMIYLPYIDGASDERQYLVMSDREQWFRVVMGQETVSEMITPESETMIPLPQRIIDELSFNLSLIS